MAEKKWHTISLFGTPVRQWITYITLSRHIMGLGYLQQQNFNHLRLVKLCDNKNCQVKNN